MLSGCAAIMFASSFNLCLLFKKIHGAKKMIVIIVKKKGIGGNDLHSLKPGPSCSKLTTSLVKETLKFQKLISQICQYFLLKNCGKLLPCKSLSHFFNKKYQCICL